MQKDTKIALAFCGFFLGLLVVSAFARVQGVIRESSSDGVGFAMENGVQVVTIAAKGGFTPNVVHARAGVPTELRFTTDGTYDCSSSVVIPSLRYKKFLSPTGTETVPLSAEQATGTLDGACGMGMYTFKILFT